VRKKVRGTTEMPRLSVFRSSRHIYAQVIDDSSGKTLIEASSLSKELSTQIVGVGEKKKVAALVGANVGKKALDNGIKKVVFDRNGFLYHGRVKALAEGARESGLRF
jgi:large subunit ribosomal protein L18